MEYLESLIFSVGIGIGIGFVSVFVSPLCVYLPSEFPKKEKQKGDVNVSANTKNQIFLSRPLSKYTNQRLMMKECLSGLEIFHRFVTFQVSRSPWRSVALKC